MKKILLFILSFLSTDLICQSNWGIINYQCDSIKVYVTHNEGKDASLILEKMKNNQVFVPLVKHRINASDSSYVFNNLEDGEYRVLFLKDQVVVSNNYRYMLPSSNQSSVQVLNCSSVENRQLGLRKSNKINIMEFPQFLGQKPC